MSPEQRTAIREQYPEHFFARLLYGEFEALIAIPKAHADRELPGAPGVTVDMLHGATIRLKERA